MIGSVKILTSDNRVKKAHGKIKSMKENALPCVGVMDVIIVARTTPTIKTAKSTRLVGSFIADKTLNKHKTLITKRHKKRAQTFGKCAELCTDRNYANKNPFCL